MSTRSEVVDSCPARFRGGWATTMTLGALLLAVASPACGKPLPGTYRLTGGPDTASELVIRANGTFTYMLSAGALDEHAAGSWVVAAGALHLKTAPRPAPPAFAAAGKTRSADATLVLHVIAPGGAGIGGVDLQVGFDTGEPETGYTQDYGWRLPDGEMRNPRWVVFSVPMYQLTSRRFAIDRADANDLIFVLTPNDLGVVDFDRIQIDVEPGRLVMHRGDALLVFEVAASRGRRGGKARR